MPFYPNNRTFMTGVRWRKKGHPANGFTLIEILVALSVFAVLMSIVLGALSFLLSKTASIKEGITVYEEARVCLDRLTTDLRAVYVSVAPGYEPPGLGDDPDPYRFFCESSGTDEVRLNFTTFSHLSLGGGIPSKAGNIMYYLWETENDGRVLMRRDVALKTDKSADRMLNGGDAGTDPILCRHVKRFDITCFDQDGTEHDSWDSDSKDFSYATPVAVRVSIDIEDVHAGYHFETMVSIPVFREKIANAQ